MPDEIETVTVDEATADYYGEWRFTRRGWVREKIVTTVEVRAPTKAPKGWRKDPDYAGPGGCVGMEGFKKRSGDVCAMVWADAAGGEWHWLLYWDLPEGDGADIASGKGPLRRCIAAAEKALAKYKGKHPPPEAEEEEGVPAPELRVADAAEIWCTDPKDTEPRLLARYVARPDDDMLACVESNPSTDVSGRQSYTLVVKIDDAVLLSYSIKIDSEFAIRAGESKLARLFPVLRRDDLPASAVGATVVP